MNSSKINLLLLPLLVSILLCTLSKLKIGQSFNNLIYAVFTPVSFPMNQAKIFTKSQKENFLRLPELRKELQNQKITNSRLLSENQNLKNLILDQKIIANLHTPSFQPIHLINLGKTITASVNQNINQIQVGQPVVTGTILLGLVSEINNGIITIVPLSDDNIPLISTVTSSGQKGSYRYNSRTPQITDVPSQTPLILNDVLFTLPSKKIPPNLILGKLVKILSSSQEPLQRAEIKIETTITDSLTDLFVIISP